MDKTLDGYHYARMEALNTPGHVGQIYNLTLFANNWDARQWYWVGKITAAEVITREMSDDITDEYQQRGWLTEQFWQLEQLEGINVQRYRDNEQRFNVRFKPENFQSYDRTPFSESETPPSDHYNLPTLKAIPAFLLYKELDDEDDDLIFGSEDESGPKKKIKREYKPQVRELENVHRHVQAGYANYLRRNRPEGHEVYTESYMSKSKVRVDIVEVIPSPQEKKMIFYEVKTYTSSRYSIRAAIGQLFEYAYFSKKKRTDQFVIVSHLQASPDELAYLVHLGEKLGIALSYVCFDWKTKSVIEP